MPHESRMTTARQTEFQNQVMATRIQENEMLTRRVSFDFDANDSTSFDPGCRCERRRPTDYAAAPSATAPAWTTSTRRPSPTPVARPAARSATPPLPSRRTASGTRLCLHSTTVKAETLCRISPPQLYSLNFHYSVVVIHMLLYL